MSEPAMIVVRLRARGLPGAAIPRVEDFVEVESLTVDSTGLVDVLALRSALTRPTDAAGED